VRSGPVQGSSRTTPDSNLEPAVHGTWGDACYEHSTRSDGELGVGHGHTATPREPSPATTLRRTQTAPPHQSLLPTVSATTTAIQGCGTALTFDALRATQRIRLLAQIESGIRAMQLLRRRSLLDVCDADLKLRSRNEAAAARRRGQFAESARLAQIRRDMLAASAKPAPGTSPERTGNNAPGTYPATSPRNGRRRVANAASPVRTRTRARTRSRTRASMIGRVVPVRTSADAGHTDRRGGATIAAVAALA
jgi:hypothetical protein